MSTEERDRFRALFDRLIELPAAERAAVLAAEPNLDASLRHELEKRLHHCDLAEQERFLEDLDFLSNLEQTLAMPKRLGQFSLQTEIGRGGTGIVFRAIQEGLNREAAVKILALGAFQDDGQARFEAEAKAIAAFQDPHIVQVFEYGAHDGVLYLAMEYVAGGTLANKLAIPWPQQQAALLVETLARTMQTAHDRGIVHRDLKPANILLTPSGTPKIADFGLVKWLEIDEGPTQTGVIMGTPGFMAPEQARPAETAIGPSVDIYSLGAILYALLTGRPPFRTGNPLETLALQQKSDPVPLRHLCPGLARDVETICLKCLEKDPSRRYETAAALADDLRRFQADEPIRARPANVWLRTCKWMKRRPAAAALTGSLFMTGLLFVGALIWRNLEAEEQNVRLQEQTTIARQKTHDAVMSLEKSIEANKKTEQARLRAEGLLYASQLAQAQSLWELGKAAAARKILAATRPEFRGWEFDHLHYQFEQRCVTLLGHSIGVKSVCFSSTGALLASASEGENAAVAAGEIKVWNLAPKAEERFTLVNANRGAVRVQFSPDGKSLACFSRNRQVTLWDMTTGKMLQACDAETANGAFLSFSPDGQQVAFTNIKKGIKVWEAVSARAVTPTRDMTWIQTGVLSNDRKLEAVMPSKRTVVIRNRATSAELTRLEGHTQEIRGVCFSPSGDRVATASVDESIKVWEIPSGKLRFSLIGHEGSVNSVCFTPDGKQLASAGRDGSVKIWDADIGQDVRAFRHRNWVNHLSFSRDGTSLVSASHDKTVAIWDVASGTKRRSIEGYPHWVRAACLSPCGDYVVSADRNRVAVTTVQDGSTHSVLDGAAAEIQNLRMSPDGKRLVAVGGTKRIKDRILGGEIVLWDFTAKTKIKRIEGHTEAALHGLCFSPDGKWFATAGQDAITLWNTEDGTERRRLTVRVGPVYRVCSSSDGRYVASAHANHVIKIWDAQSGECLRDLIGHDSYVSGVCFNHDGTRLASSGNDQTVRIWHTPSGQELLTLRGHQGHVHSVMFSPDGKRLASSSSDGSIRIWETEQRVSLSQTKSE